MKWQLQVKRMILRIKNVRIKRMRLPKKYLLISHLLEQLNRQSLKGFKERNILGLSILSRSHQDKSRKISPPTTLLSPQNPQTLILTPQRTFSRWVSSSTTKSRKSQRQGKFIPPSSWPLSLNITCTVLESFCRSRTHPFSLNSQKGRLIVMGTKP